MKQSMTTTPTKTNRKANEQPCQHKTGKPKTTANNKTGGENPCTW